MNSQELKARRILSPLRLPIPPLRHEWFFLRENLEFVNEIMGDQILNFQEFNDLVC